MTKIQKKSVKKAATRRSRSTDKKNGGLFQRTTPLDLFRSNKLAISLVVLIAAASFGIYKYYQRENASAYITELCGQDGGVPCWKYWTKLGITKDPNGVEMQGQACIRRASGSNPAQYLFARVWSTNDAPPKGNYSMYVAYGPLDVVTNFSKSVIQKRVKQSIYYNPSNDASGSQSVAIFEPLVAGDGNVGKIAVKDPRTDQDNYVIYGYRLEGGYYSSVQSKPVSVNDIKKIGCYGDGANIGGETTSEYPTVTSNASGTNNAGSTDNSQSTSSQEATKAKTAADTAGGIGNEKLCEAAKSCGTGAEKTNNSTIKAGSSSAYNNSGAVTPSDHSDKSSQAQNGSITDILLTPWRWALGVLGLEN